MIKLDDKPWQPMCFITNEDLAVAAEYLESRYKRVVEETTAMINLWKNA